MTCNQLQSALLSLVKHMTTPPFITHLLIYYQKSAYWPTDQIKVQLKVLKSSLLSVKLSYRSRNFFIYFWQPTDFDIPKAYYTPFFSQFFEKSFFGLKIDGTSAR